MAIGILVVRLDMFAQYGVEALEEQPETDATVKSWNRNFWMKMRTTMGTRSPYGFNLFDDIDISVNEWKTDLYTKYGPTIQIIVSFTVLHLIHMLTDKMLAIGYRGLLGAYQKVNHSCKHFI